MITVLEVARAVAPGAAQNAADTVARPTRVQVVLYDPLADAGLYQQWNAGYIDVPVETAASGVRGNITFTASDGGAEQTREVTVADADAPNADLILDEDDIAADSFVTIAFPGFRPRGDFAAQLSIHTEDGEVTAGVLDADTGDVVSDGNPLDEPHARGAFRLRAGATYKIRIWLKPKAIVLHWSVGRRQSSLNSKAGRSYHFVVSEVDGAAEWACGTSATDPRFWRHNLRIDGVPRVPGVDDVVIAANKGLETKSRPRHWQKGEAAEPTGYAGHAGSFNTHTIGVSAEGMLGSTESLIEETRAITDAQVDVLISRVADICRAWRIDATSAHNLCTHYEVNRLHLGMDPASKWDITWLPEGKQNEYQDTYGRPLCTRSVPEGTPPPADQQYRYRRYVDAPLDGTFTQANTDRVSAYLRERIDALI